MCKISSKKPDSKISLFLGGVGCMSFSGNFYSQSFLKGFFFELGIFVETRYEE